MRVKAKLLKAGDREKSHVSILHGSGALSVESGLQTFVSGKILVLLNGEYSNRIRDSLLSAPGNRVTCIQPSFGYFGNPFDPNLIERVLAEKHYDWVCLVHHETTTGILNPLKEICDRVDGTRVFVDAVSSFGAHPVDPRADVVCFNSNKCLESIPGAAVVVWKNSLEVCRKVIPYLNANEYRDDKIPYTPNTNAIVALDTALDLFFEEDRYARYAEISSYIRKIGKSRHFPLFLKNSYSNVLNSFIIDPEKYPALYWKAARGGFIIYAGKLSGQFRIANMGKLVTKQAVDRLFECITCED
jgi:2-aminoethylphosphonate-pyruvate transaminase